MQHASSRLWSLGPWPSRSRSRLLEKALLETSLFSSSLPASVLCSLQMVICCCGNALSWSLSTSSTSSSSLVGIGGSQAGAARSSQKQLLGFTITSPDTQELEAPEFHDEEEGRSTSERTPLVRATSGESAHTLLSQGAPAWKLQEDEDDQTRDRYLAELQSNMSVRPPGARRNTITPIRPSLIGALEFRGCPKFPRKEKHGPVSPSVCGGTPKIPMKSWEVE